MKFQNPILDRIWLTLIAVAFVVMVPIWLILSVERMGWRFVLLGLYVALTYRFFMRPPTDDASKDQTSSQ